jgi:flavin reductase (DIM6/NTAB) family NADH-FMN oxidoreductase RutF
LASFNASGGTTNRPLIRAADAFCVNILAEGQRRLSVQMSRSGTSKFASVD